MHPLAVLLVEDSPRDAELVLYALEEAGYAPFWERVETAEAMRAALGRRTWDIVIADFSMPEFSGLAALECLKASGSDIPFLLVSGTVGEETAVAAMRAGAHDYLLKDNLTRLAAAVDRELREAGQRRQRREAEATVREHERRFRAMFDQAAVGVAQSDLEGRWLLVNQRLVDFYGYSWDELSQLRFHDVTHPDDLKTDLVKFGQLLSGEIPSYTLEKRFIRKDGSMIWGQVTVSLVRDQEGMPRYTMALVEDISERKRAEATLKHQALHDALTGLPNRLLLQDRLEQAIQRARRNLSTVALLLIDLDRFKEINDTFGHRAGDLLLRELGPRLERLLRESDTVARPGQSETTAREIARLGGDEFAVLLPEASIAGAAAVAARILDALGQPFEIEGQALDIGASIGVAIFPDHGDTADLLLQHADVAMYRAKRTDVGVAQYDAAEDPYTRARLALIADLRHALGANELTVYYQPKVDLDTQMVLGAEALVRWEHPQQGFIPPSQIIEIAEHTGLIKPLSLWVLSAALRECRRWRDTGWELSVAVNLSARSLHDHELPSLIADALTTVGLEPSALIIEITETAVMIDPARASTIIGQLSAMGVGVSLDDFGTGYSSLSYLKTLPASEVKIDRSFVQEMDRTPDDWRIVRSAITLAHDLGLQSVAEGIETEKTWQRLHQLGCDAGQGYYLARPMPPNAFLQWLATARTPQRTSA